MRGMEKNKKECMIKISVDTTELDRAIEKTKQLVMLMEKQKRLKQRRWREQLLLRLLLGKKRDLFTVMKIKGKVYGVSIQPYISPEDAFKEAVNSGVFTADNLKVGD